MLSFCALLVTAMDSQDHGYNMHPETSARSKTITAHMDKKILGHHALTSKLFKNQPAIEAVTRSLTC